MSDDFTPMMRALVAAALLLASATLMLVAVNAARAAGALAIGNCGAFGEACDYHTMAQARRSALAKCTSAGCPVVTSIRGGCAALAVDYGKPCGTHGWGKAAKLGRAQNAALRSCYHDGAQECVIRTFFCDGQG
jgi:Domain of unknown function (DUF4189)